MGRLWLSITSKRDAKSDKIQLRIPLSMVPSDHLTSRVPPTLQRCRTDPGDLPRSAPWKEKLWKIHSHQKTLKRDPGIPVIPWGYLLRDPTLYFIVHITTAPKHPKSYFTVNSGFYYAMCTSFLAKVANFCTSLIGANIVMTSWAWQIYCDLHPKFGIKL